MDGYSKSHFSHMCNDLERETLRPLILERFWQPKSYQDRKKNRFVPKSIWKILQTVMQCYIDVWSFLDPQTILKSYMIKFLGFCCRSYTMLAPDVDFQRFLTTLEAIFEATFDNSLSQFTSNYMLTFLRSPKPFIPLQPIASQPSFDSQSQGASGRGAAFK